MKSSLSRALIVLGLFAIVAAFAKDGPQGLRFDSAGVLDLAERSQKMPGTRALPATLLSAAEAAKILAAPPLTEDKVSLPFSDDVYSCKTPARACSQTHERELLTAADGAVKRIDRQLIVAGDSGKPLIFADWKMPETKTADGDEETHWYLGRMSGNGYHRVEVQFGHDAPGSFLINLQSGKVAFVHNGADIVSVSPDGMHLVTFNALNPPLSIRVAALDAAGPRLELQCEVGANASDVGAQFKGWSDAASFDLEVLSDQGWTDQNRTDQEQNVPASALRFTRQAGAWNIAASDPKKLATISFTCH